MRFAVGMVHSTLMNSWARTVTHPFAIAAAVAFAVTGVLYGDVLGLPFFSDDLIQLPWQETVSWSALWSTPSPYGYYRPLSYTIWRVWGFCTGGLQPFGLHLLNLIGHVAVAWLAALLADTWIVTASNHWARAVPAAFTAATVAAFPFSRQAVAWVSAVTYPIVTALALFALLTYDRGRREHGSIWFYLSLTATALAPFAHEIGLFVGPLILIAGALGRLHGRWANTSRWPWAYVCTSGLGLVGWRILIDRSVVGFGLNVTSLARNVGYLLQGLVYPVAPLSLGLAETLRIEPWITLWVVGLLALGLLIWCGLYGNRLALLLGASWFGLFVVPPMVTMEADWFAQAPRFLYIAGVGISLVWASVVAWCLRIPQRRVGVVLVGLMSVGTLVPAARFIRTGVRLYEMAGESIWDAARESAQARSPLFVNLPSRLTPERRHYPVGSEAIIPLPDEVDVQSLIYAHTGIRRPATSISFGVVTAADSPSGYDYELFGQPASWDDVASGIRSARGVYLTRYEGNRISLLYAGSSTASAPRSVSRARFADAVSLLDVVATCDSTGKVRLSTTWRVEQQVDADVTVFSHLLGPDGAIVSQADGYPLLGLFPFWLWRPGETGRDVRYFEGISPASYTVRLGLWEPVTGYRWPTAKDIDGTVLLSVLCR